MKYTEWKSLSKEEKKKLKWKDLPRFNKIALCFFCGTLVFIVGLFLILDFDTKPKELPDKFSAYLMAKRYVENNLKSPKSADFSCCDYTDQINRSDSTYIIASYVDATNSFNANIRSKWAVKMKYLGEGNWRLLDISIE